MKKVKKIAQIIALVLVVFTIGYLSVSAIQKRNQAQHQSLKIDLVDEDLKFVEEEDVKALIQLKMDSLQGKTIQEIELNQLERVIESSAYVKKSDVYINNSKEIGVKIWQKRPLFRVRQQNGVDYYVDELGKKFPKSTKFIVKVPIVSGALNYKVDSLGNQVGKGMNSVLKFIQFLDKNDFAKSVTTTISVDRAGELSFISRLKGYQVLVGQPENLVDKFQRLQLFYSEGLSREGWNKYSTVNLKYKNQVIAKRKNP